MIQWAEGVRMDPWRPLMPVIMRSLAHDEKYQPLRHCAPFPCHARAAPRLVGGRHLLEGTGAMMQWAEGVGIVPSRPLVPVIKRCLTHDEMSQPLRHCAPLPSHARAAPRDIYPSDTPPIQEPATLPIRARYSPDKSPILFR